MPRGTASGARPRTRLIIVGLLWGRKGLLLRLLGALNDSGGRVVERIVNLGVLGLAGGARRRPARGRSPTINSLVRHIHLEGI